MGWRTRTLLMRIIRGDVERIWRDVEGISACVEAYHR